MAEPDINAPEDDKPERWLLYRLSSLGDVVLCTGLLRYLHRRYGWRFAVLTRAEFAPVFANNPFVFEVITPSREQLSFPANLGYFNGLAAAHRGWGLLDLHASLRSRLLGALWRGPVRRYPKFRAERARFLRTRSPELSEFLRASSVTQRYALALESPAPPRGELLPEIFLTGEESEAARARLATIRRSNTGPLVAMHPYATHERKAWPRGHWLELMRLLEARGWDWVLVGRGEPFAPGDPRDLANSTGLRELAAILAQADTLVTGDSGPMHLAGAVGTPVLALFGPTTAEWGFFPAGERDRVLELELACRPCSLHGAAGGEGGCDRRCLTGISPPAVLAALEGQLASCAARSFDAG